MQKQSLMNNSNLKLLAGIIVLGSIWGLLECALGGIKFTGALTHFPMGAVLGGGVGLGLALVKEIVQAHGGQISVWSVVDRGSTFRVTLPAAATG